MVLVLAHHVVMLLKIGHIPEPPFLSGPVNGIRVKYDEWIPIANLRDFLECIQEYWEGADGPVGEVLGTSR